MLVTSSNYHGVIDARHVTLGINVHIEDGVHISAIGGTAERIEIGDNVYIGRDCVILVPQLRIGDYATIHKHCRISGYSPCHIGHNFWIDQNCILNATDRFSIGNNVGVGAYSQFWTHIQYGDVLEGCRFNRTKEMVIGNDVWFVGHCVVSPIVAKDKSMAMLGSVVVKDMEENRTYGGCPAKDMTEIFGPQFAARSLEEKYAMMVERRGHFLSTHPEVSGNLLQIVAEYPGQMDPDVSYFNVGRRAYTKRRSPAEIAFMKFLLPLYKFLPEDSL
jgi:acetyltransferase-like isoleucine patch superfamily enzyme